MGLITFEERREKVVDKWTAATDEVAEAMEANLDRLNPIYMMANSGARGSFTQIRQLAGMRGPMTNPKGEIIERPIKANFMEGLTVLEYFISTHGARKGLADTALRTADSGYLTRRLVDVAQDVIVREDDCKTKGCIDMAVFADGGRRELEPGRPRRGEADQRPTGEVLVDKNHMIRREDLDRIAAAFEDEPEADLPIRSVLKCEAESGLCRACYGVAMATGSIVELGDAVGIIAAQSIGEPGTQLTMRTFHTGGVAGADITHGLPRVVELFEARKPKGVATMSEVAGTVAVEEHEKTRTVTVLDSKGEEHDYDFPRGLMLRVTHGQKIEAGEKLVEGPLYPAELLQIRGRTATERYLVEEVQAVYKSQGVDINDKHIEVIVRQMLKRLRVDRKGDTDYLPGQLVDANSCSARTRRSRPPVATRPPGEEVILGITKASLATDSFLSAASFQETTKVLTDAALEGKIDRLLGLKENVIIGKLIPAATGLRRYRTLEIEPTEPFVRPTPEEIGLIDEDTLVAELGLGEEGLEGLGAEISTSDFGDDFASDFDLAEGGAAPASQDGDEG